MTDIKRKATASWQGDKDGGSGKMSGQSGLFRDLPFSFPSRFAQEQGTNPEELLGAAHAACFNMVIADVLSDQGNPPQEVNTEATVTLKEAGGGFAISAIELVTKGTVEGLDAATFEEVAQIAKENCPVSQLLKPGLEKLTVKATLN